MNRFLIAATLAVLAAAAAAQLGRRTRRQPVNSPSWHVPVQLQRGDFARPEAAWLVALFSSATCEACQAVWERTVILGSAEVVVQRLDASADRACHQRYRIDAVPLVLIADAQGVVRRHFLGPVNSADLWGALAELR